MANAFDAYTTAKSAAFNQGLQQMAMDQQLQTVGRQNALRNAFAGAYRPGVGVDWNTAMQNAQQTGVVPEMLQLQSALTKSDQGFTLKPGETRYSSGGRVIASMPVEGGMQETDPTAPWAKIRDPKKRDEAQMRWGIKADTELAKMQEDSDKARNMNQDIDRFLFLNKENRTGPGTGLFGARGALDPGYKEMSSISDRLTPAMRQGLPGAASDRDVAMFRGGTVSVDKQPEVNRNIGLGLKIMNQNKIDRQNFYSDYVNAKGHLRGAKQAWRSYLEANPIFDPNAPEGAYKLNESRQNYQQWFESGMPSRSAIIGQTGQVDRSNQLIKPPIKGEIRNGYMFMGGDYNDQKNWKMAR